MFRQDFESSPFKRSRVQRYLSAIPRWFSRVMQSRAERQMHRARPHRLARVVGRLNTLLYWTGMAVCGLFSTLASPFRHLARKFIFRPLNRWLIAAEEKRNQLARVGPIRKGVRACRRQLRHLSEWLEEHSTLFRWISRPIRYLARIPGRFTAALVKGYERLEERLAKSKWLYGLYFLMWAVRYVANATVEFFRYWFVTRNYYQLVGGLPAIMLFLPLAFCLVRVPLHSATAKARHYRMAAQDAWEAGDFDAARLYYRKIQQIGISVETALFQTAISADQEGDVDEAYRQMQTMVEQYDFAPAKLWIVQALLSDRLAHPPADAEQICDDYLRTILMLDARNPTAVMLQAQRYRQQGRVQEALAALQAITREYPPANLMISQIQGEQKNYEQAVSYLRNTLDYYESRYQSGTMLDVSEYESWIRALIMEGNYRRMDEVAAGALLVHPDSHRLKEFVVKRSGEVCDRLIADPRNTELVAQLLEHALEVDPSNEATMERVALLVNDPKVGPQAQQFLSRNGGKLPANVHGALAIAACLRQDFVTARTHFREVVAAHPNSGEAANNLAWILMNTEPIELDEALALATRAIEIAPNSAAFHETRGQILFKMGRWQEAIQELELALNGLPDERGIHDVLAKAYEQLGNLALAEAHRSQAVSDSPGLVSDRLGPP